MPDTEPEPFWYDAEVDPGEKRHVRYEIGETYLKNPVEIPGHPLCHLARIDTETHEEIERETRTGEFDGYRTLGARGMGDED